MPRLKIEAPVTVYALERRAVAHVSPSCAGAQTTMALRREDVKRRLCKRCRQG